MKRDLRNVVYTHTHNKCALCASLSFVIIGKRPLKETYICEKRPIYMKRDLRNAVYTHTQQVHTVRIVVLRRHWKETLKRDLHM